MMFQNRKTAAGAGSWNTIVNGIPGFSDSAMGQYLKEHPGDDQIRNKQAMQQALDRFGGATSNQVLRRWAQTNQSGFFRNGYSFDTGGYTGAWGTEGRLAFLHQKELVLNADDTENMLNIVQMVRDITSAIDTRASLASVANINNGMYGSVGAGAQALDQNVHIEANFPNVTDHNEIEMALSNLVNQAAQYANRKS